MEIPETNSGGSGGFNAGSVAAGAQVAAQAASAIPGAPNKLGFTQMGLGLAAINPIAGIAGAGVGLAADMIMGGINKRKADQAAFDQKVLTARSAYTMHQNPYEQEGGYNQGIPMLYKGGYVMKRFANGGQAPAAHVIPADKRKKAIAHARAAGYDIDRPADYDEQEGGIVTGPGGPKSDAIVMQPGGSGPIRVSDGEAVVNDEVFQRMARSVGMGIAEYQKSMYPKGLNEQMYADGGQVPPGGYAEDQLRLMSGTGFGHPVLSGSDTRSLLMKAMGTGEQSPFPEAGGHPLSVGGQGPPGTLFKQPSMLAVDQDLANGSMEPSSILGKDLRPIQRSTPNESVERIAPRPGAPLFRGVEPIEQRAPLGAGKSIASAGAADEGGDGFDASRANNIALGVNTAMGVGSLLWNAFSKRTPGIRPPAYDPQMVDFQTEALRSNLDNRRASGVATAGYRMTGKQGLGRDLGLRSIDLAQRSQDSMVVENVENQERQINTGATNQARLYNNQSYQRFLEREGAAHNAFRREKGDRISMSLSGIGQGVGHWANNRIQLDQVGKSEDAFGRYMQMRSGGDDTVSLRPDSILYPDGRLVHRWNERRF